VEGWLSTTADKRVTIFGTTVFRWVGFTWTTSTARAETSIRLFGA
jgi:hypothetical protein